MREINELGMALMNMKAIKDAGYEGEEAAAILLAYAILKHRNAVDEGLMSISNTLFSAACND